MQGKLKIPGWVAENKHISSSYSAVCVQQFPCISVLKMISKKQWAVWWSAALETQNPALAFHLCLAELWSHVQLLFAPNLNKPEADHGCRNSFVFYGLNSYTGLWPWFPQEQVWGGCCSQQEGPTWGGDNWDPKWELYFLLYLLLLWRSICHIDLTNVGQSGPSKAGVASGARVWAPQQPHILPMEFWG